MVDLVVLSGSYIVGVKWFADFTVWRHRERDHSFGDRTTVASFLKDYFGFHQDHLHIVAVVLILNPLVLASLFAFFIGKLNFQKR